MPLLRSALSAGVCLLALTAAASGSVSREQLTEYFQPDRVQRATLSPDGDHVGYVVTEPDSVSVVLRQVEDPDVKTAVRVDLLARAPGRVEVKYLGWASRDWLVYLVALPDREQTWAEELHAIDVRDFKDRLLLKSSALGYILSGDPLPAFRPAPGILSDHMVKTPDVAAESKDPDTRLAMREAEAQISRTPKLPNYFRFSRRVRVLASDAHLPVVWLEAYGESQIETSVYRLLVDPRKIEVAGPRRPGGERVLYDRAGEPRLMETARSLYSRRQSFQILEHRPEPVWRSLDEALGVPAQFSHEDDSDYFSPRTFPLAFDADPSVLYLASNVGSNTFRIQRVDLLVRQVSDLPFGELTCDVAGPADAFSDSGLVFDTEGRLAGVRVPGVPGTTRWMSAGGRELQRQVEGFFPGRTVDVLAWNDAGTRALLMTSGPSDPGRYYIFHPGERPRAVELARRKSALTADALAVTRPFDFTTSAGVRLCGSLTLPGAPRRRPPPLVVLCRDIPGPGLVGTTYEPAAHALAALGFMVLDVNYRGRAGLGTVHREAVRQGFDRVPIQDIRAAMAYVRRLEPFDVRRVALFGEGFGGYVALRALELFPNEFRTAVVANAPVDLRSWAANERAGTLTSGGSAAGRRAFFTASEALATAPSLETGGPLRQRVLLLRFPDDRAAAALRATLKRRHCDVDTGGVPAAVETRDAGALGASFARIGDFLNGALFDYRVDVGKEEPVP